MGKKALVTGSGGLVGSEMVKLLCAKGFIVYGIDNDRRAYFFGPEASTQPTTEELLTHYDNFHHIIADIRDYYQLRLLFEKYGPFDFICHAAAQPAHDWSIEHVLEDFDINAKGTVNMLEVFRRQSPEATFIQVSTSKVYGDNVNTLPLVELETRWELSEDLKYSYDMTRGDYTWEGVTEEMSIQDCIHSPFGASKACGDMMAQEFARYYGLKIAIFRPVCITGPAHKGAKLHGYLAYLIKCIATGELYTINGYSGKQVRDNIHAYDLVSAFWEVHASDRPCYGEFFNIGGGRESNNSIVEAIEQAEFLLSAAKGRKITANVDYSETNRRGDHKWCIFDSSKFKKAYPNWELTYNNDRLMADLCNAYKED